ncbi:MAG: hypothetical protein ABW159_19335 [Candidatus Thiodiazotropha sp.]
MPEEKQEGLKLSFFLSSGYHVVVIIGKWFFGARTHEVSTA